MTRIVLQSIVSPFVVVAFVACGGSSTPAAETAPEPANAPAAETSSLGAEEPEAAEEESAKAAGEEPEEQGPGGGRTAKDVLTAPDVLFMFSWTQSESARAAEEACDKKHEGKPEARANCVAQAKKKFVIDGVRLKKDADGTYWWVAFARKGNALQALNNFQVEFGEETKTSIVLKPVGRDKGKKPRARLPKQIVVKVPNDYSIVVEDPDQGTMVYEAKIGITEAQ